MSSSVPIVGLLGAYERDNFGDVLFLELSRKYLADIESIALAPFVEDTNSGGPYPTERYADVARARRLSSVLTVGGEVGGTSVASALKMSASAQKLASWGNMATKSRKRMVADEIGLSMSASPYLPRMSSMSSTLSVPYAINSAGLSGMQNLVGSRRAEAWTAVREACFVSVRDQQSSRMLNKAGVAHRLAPDLVHTLRNNPEFVPDDEPEVALVQVKGAVLKRLGPQRLAEILIASKSLRPYNLRFFAAGYATGHDSFDLYQEVADRFSSIDPSRSISMPRGGSALEKAQQIAGCGLWIGTSLHGWIISSSFNRARVAIELEKIVRYADTWDDPMPTGVEVADLDDAVQTAIDGHRRASSGEIMRTSSLADQADVSIRTALSRLADDLPEKEIARRSESNRTLDVGGPSILRKVVDHIDFLRSI